MLICVFVYLCIHQQNHSLITSIPHRYPALLVYHGVLYQRVALPTNYLPTYLLLSLPSKILFLRRLCSLINKTVYPHATSTFTLWIGTRDVVIAVVVVVADPPRQARRPRRPPPIRRDLPPPIS